MNAPLVLEGLHVRVVRGPDVMCGVVHTVIYGWNHLYRLGKMLFYDSDIEGYHEVGDCVEITLKETR